MPDWPSGPPTAELLGRYLAGETTLAERDLVLRYLEHNPAVARTLDQYVRGLDAEDNRPEPPDAVASLSALKRRMASEDVAVVERGAEPRRRVAPSAPPPVARRWRRVLGVGGVAAAAAIAMVAYHRRRERPLPTQRTYVTVDGERAHVQLRDGTLVELAPGSRLRVAADFGGQRRDVYLEGEAYFEVAHDVAHPFTVYAGATSARDLGTAFAVRAFAADRDVEVVVRAGLVAMQGVGRLGAGDVGSIAADGRASISRHADVAAMLGWVDGRLAFNDAPLGRVLADVRRWYGIDVELADTSLAALPFTGVLSDAGPADAVSLLAATLGLRVETDRERLVLHAVPGRTPMPGAEAPVAR